MFASGTPVCNQCNMRWTDFWTTTEEPPDRHEIEPLARRATQSKARAMFMFIQWRVLQSHAGTILDKSQRFDFKGVLRGRSMKATRRGCHAQSRSLFRGSQNQCDPRSQGRRHRLQRLRGRRRQRHDHQEGLPRSLAKRLLPQPERRARRRLRPRWAWRARRADG